MTTMFRSPIRTARMGMMLVGAAVLVATTAQAALIHAEDAVTLALTVKAGDVVKYNREVSTSVGGNDVVVKTVSKHEVKEVKPSGEVVTIVSDEGGKLSLGGMEQDAPQSPSVTETRDKAGKLTKVEAAADNPVFPPEVVTLMAAAREVVFSGKPVKSGDKWETEIDNPAVKGKKIVLKGSYAGVDKLDGKDYWKVKQAGEAVMNAQGEKATFDLTEWRDMTTGRLEKSEATVKGVPTSMFGALDFVMKTTRVK